MLTFVFSVGLRVRVKIRVRVRLKIALGAKVLPSVLTAILVKKNT